MERNFSGAEKTWVCGLVCKELTSIVANKILEGSREGAEERFGVLM